MIPSSKKNLFINENFSTGSEDDSIFPLDKLVLCVSFISSFLVYKFKRGEARKILKKVLKRKIDREFFQEALQLEELKDQFEGKNEFYDEDYPPQEQASEPEKAREGNEGNDVAQRYAIGRKPSKTPKVLSKNLSLSQERGTDDEEEEEKEEVEQASERIDSNPYSEYQGDILPLKSNIVLCQISFYPA